MKKLFSYLVAQKIILGAVGVVALAVGGFIYWDSNTNDYTTITVSRGDFVQTVSVSGKVVAENEVDLGFSQSGRISRVYVKEGGIVNAGDLIAEVENGELYGAQLQKQAALDRATAQLDALKRGTRPEELAVSESAVQSAQASVVAANQAVVDAVLSAYSTSDGAIHATVDQFFSNPNSTSPQVTFYTGNTSLKSSVESRRVGMESLLNDWLARNGTLTSQSDLVKVSQDAQSSLQQIATYLGDVGATLATSIPSASVSQATLDGYKTAVATARASVNTVTSTLTTAVKTQTAAQTALVTAERDLSLKRAGTTQEDIRAQEASVKAAEADVLSATAQLQKTQIRAPFKGTVTKVDAKVGKSVAPSESQVSVIGSGVFQIETFVPEINVSLVKKGDPAEVTFDSYGSDARFTASVLTVDLGVTSKDGVSTYRTILVFSGADDRIRSGMTANVIITTLKKPDVLAIPQKLVVQKDGVSTVRVLRGEVDTPVAVTTGALSAVGDIEILSGLSVGDQVILK